MFTIIIIIAIINIIIIRSAKKFLNYFFIMIIDCLKNIFRVLYFDPRPSPKILFQGDTPEGSDTFQWPLIERDRVGGLRLMIWDKVKVPLCQYSDASEESNCNDSYFRLMTIKHSISKIQWVIVWALNYYLTQLISECQAVASRIPDS